MPTHLAGTKKIQQVLSDPATLDRFLGRIQKKGGFVMSGNTRAVAKALFAKGDDEVGKQYADMLEQLPLSERLQRTMMTQVDPQQLVAEAKTKVNSPTPSLLPSPSHSASIQPHPRHQPLSRHLRQGESEIIAAALARPEDWVLKPQREGGGNNLFFEDLKAELNRVCNPDKHTMANSYTLMRKIDVVAKKGFDFIMKGRETHSPDGISECGMFSVFFADGAEVKLNELGGAHARTKPPNVSETYQDGHYNLIY